MLFLSNQQVLMSLFRLSSSGADIFCGLSILSLSKNEKLSMPFVASLEPVFQGLFTMRCFSQLSLLTGQLRQLIPIDPLRCELPLKVLAHLDANSLCRVAQVRKRWKPLAGDGDDLWCGIREQYITQNPSSVAGTAYS